MGTVHGYENRAHVPYRVYRPTFKNANRALLLKLGKLYRTTVRQLHYITLHHPTLQLLLQLQLQLQLRYTTLPYSTVHYATLNCITLHYTN